MTPPGRSRCTQNDSIKTVLKEIDSDDVCDWTELAQDSVQWETL